MVFTGKIIKPIYNAVQTSMT